MEKNFYHGSMNKFEAFSLDHLGKNGKEDGFGIYLTTDKEMASIYANYRDKKGYLYETSANLGNALSRTERTISDSQLSKIIDLLHESDDLLNVYNDVSYFGQSVVKNEVLELLKINKNDVDLVNELATNIGNPINVAKTIQAIGNFTHIIAENQVNQNEPVIVVLNPDNVRIEKVHDLSMEIESPTLTASADTHSNIQEKIKLAKEKLNQPFAKDKQKENLTKDSVENDIAR